MPPKRERMYLRAYEHEVARFNMLYKSLPFSERMKFGGDATEAREAIDLKIAEAEGR